jgi:hypothetical protein
MGCRNHTALEIPENRTEMKKIVCAILKCDGTSLMPGRDEHCEITEWRI